MVGGLMASTLTLAISACGAERRTSTVDSRSEASTNARVTSSPSATTSATGTTTELSAEDFASQSFDRSTVIDNKWFPLRPGTTHVYEGSANEGTDRVVRKNILIVTDLTKVIDGVRAVVIWERDYDDGELIESELALFAQDNDGNVWHLGQYPEVYEEGKLVETPTWIHGLAGARWQHHRGGAARRIDYAQGFLAAQLGRPRAGLQDGWEKLRARRLLRERPGDAGVRERHAQRVTAQVLRRRRGDRPGQLGRERR